jgi:hypothetical protein
MKQGNLKLNARKLFCNLNVEIFVPFNSLQKQYFIELNLFPFVLKYNRSRIK